MYSTTVDRVIRNLNAKKGTISINDPGKVRLGAQGPVFRPSPVADAGKVRLGAQGPLFRLSPVADAGKVRLGAQSPLFR